MDLKTVFKIAWGNTFQNLRRTVTAMGGITFSVLLIFLQLGFLEAAKKEVTLLYEYFDFDVAIVDSRYQIMATAPSFDRIRLIQAAVDPAVGGTFRLGVGSARWTNPETLVDSTMLIIGLEDKPDFILDPDLREGLSSLTDGRSVILDRFAHPDYGIPAIGLNGLVGTFEVDVTALFNLGLFFFAEGSIATNDGNFLRLAGATSDEVTVGLLKLKPGEDPRLVAARLNASLPDDVIAFDRETFFEQEHAYFVSVKPIGIMFQSAVFVAFAVGAVILYQVLSTELNNRLNEFATMKAMGFGSGFVYGIGIGQNALFVLFSFLPAAGIAAGLFKLVYDLSKLPMEMTGLLVATVFAMTLVMGLIAGVLAMRRLQRADPADLY